MHVRGTDYFSIKFMFDTMWGEHTYPEHIGRQDVHSKATEYPLKVLQRGSPFSDIYIHLEHNSSNQH